MPSQDGNMTLAGLQNRESKNFKSHLDVEIKAEEDISALGRDRLIIHQVSVAENTLTDSSIPDARSAAGMDRELNLTEYERKVRRAHGLPTDGDGSQSNKFSFVPSPKGSTANNDIRN